MKIAIYAKWDIKMEGGRIQASGWHIRYLKYFLKFAGEIRLFTNVIDDNLKFYNESFFDNRLEIVPISWQTWSEVWLHLRSFRKLFEKNLDGIEAMYVQLWSPCSWVLAPICDKLGIGMVFHIICDPIGLIMKRHDWNLLGKILRRSLFYPEELLTKRAMSNHKILINGSENAQIHKRKGICGEVIISSTLEEHDFIDRYDTCLSDDIRVLYVGVIHPPKRLEVLIKAIADLKKEGRKVHLRIVGPCRLPKYLESLKKYTRSLRIKQSVEFPGYVALGEPLNAEFRSADIFAFPSISEGSPRVLLEAAANSLPLVTTDVGSVQDLFVNGDSALVVPLNRPGAMARAIARFIDDPDLRRHCMKKAHQIAKKHLCSAFIEHIVQCLKEAGGHRYNNSNLST